MRSQKIGANSGWLVTCGHIPRAVSPHSLRLGVLRKSGASKDGDFDRAGLPTTRAI
ncbi:MAG: hypothetical protein GYA40_08915 [Chloroflexi bacterium]|nr:hypothetical protein [Chloroflexota bacterium]